MPLVVSYIVIPHVHIVQLSSDKGDQNLQWGTDFCMHVVKFGLEA